ncbi:ACL089Wp [Eremothecium gossypii ATCC 10895]|uniref:ACL089Wp n=1 Tax=Eremothecium gossypii (strain ATCC 10895 / CBS 109.51 / FGSC 9923 / NRRL Y-1056) TaxID=284811 RepID=Q75CK8_EREGS|nr:ACL089Wp [Eremothecium gossypii ATCC 10895]AAS51139.3 ACL089Wp [Eremothecium gossypii ATCC 10895]
MESVISEVDSGFLKENGSWADALAAVSWEDIGTLERAVYETEQVMQKYERPNERVRGALYGVFEEVLGRYPLLFGYWRKYAGMVERAEDAGRATETLLRGVGAFPASLELWTDYLRGAGTGPEARGLYETAAAQVGRQFLAHEFWDQYLAFETGQGAWEQVAALYARVARVPLHQYARYYSGFQEFAAAHAEAVPEGCVAEVDAAFAQTQQLVYDIWRYESRISQSFFNVTDVAEAELQNWREYLAFAVSDARMEPAQVRATFERALVPCYRYRYFWDAYITWLEGQGAHDELAAVFQRGMRALPADVPFERRYLDYLRVRTLQDCAQFRDAYRDALAAAVQRAPEDGALLNDYLNLVKTTEYPTTLDQPEAEVLEQQQAYAKFLEGTVATYMEGEDSRGSSQLLSLLDDRNISVVVVQLIKTTWLVLRNNMQAIKYFNQFGKLPQLKSSTAFWLLYYKFEKSHRNFTKLNKFVGQLGTEIFLPTEVINDILEDYQGFYLANSDVNEYERRLASGPLQFDPLVDCVFKVNDPQWSPRNLDYRDWYKSTEYRENGHPGIALDPPQITNSIITKSIASIRKQNAQPLPTFRNLEKINQPPKNADHAWEYIKS